MSQCQNFLHWDVSQSLESSVLKLSCCQLIHGKKYEKVQHSIKNWMGPNPNGPRSVSCDPAMRYSGFFGVRGPWVLLDISWKHQWLSPNLISSWKKTWLNHHEFHQLFWGICTIYLFLSASKKQIQVNWHCSHTLSLEMWKSTPKTTRPRSRIWR